MLNVFRKSVTAAVAAATIALPIATATPAAAQTYDCQLMPDGIVEEVVECVYYILITAINDPDLPPHL